MEHEKRDASVFSKAPEKLKYHPATEIFPAMSDEEFAELLEDVREHGQREPVWVDKEDRLIDGRHRVRACHELDRPVLVRVFEGDDDEVCGFVLSLNLKRRQLKGSQRAFVAARLATLRRGSNQHTSIEGCSVEQASRQLGVGRSSVERALSVLRNGIADLTSLVDCGKVSVAAAAKVAALPKIEQIAVVQQGPAEVRRLAKSCRSTTSENSATADEKDSTVDESELPRIDDSERKPNHSAEANLPLDSVEKIRLNLVKEYLDQASYSMRSAFDSWWRHRWSGGEGSQDGRPESPTAAPARREGAE